MNNIQIEDLRENKNRESIKVLAELEDWYEKLPEDNLVTWWRVTPTELAIFITNKLELAKIEAKIKTIQEEIAILLNARDLYPKDNEFGIGRIAGHDDIINDFRDRISELTKQKEELLHE